MRLTLDRQLAADLAVVLEAFINSADESAWYVDTCTKAQEKIRNQIRADDALQAHQRAAA